MTKAIAEKLNLLLHPNIKTGFIAGWRFVDGGDLQDKHGNPHPILLRIFSLGYDTPIASRIRFLMGPVFSKFSNW